MTESASTFRTHSPEPIGILAVAACIIEISAQSAAGKSALVEGFLEVFPPPGGRHRGSSGPARAAEYTSSAGSHTLAVFMNLDSVA